MPALLSILPVGLLVPRADVPPGAYPTVKIRTASPTSAMPRQTNAHICRDHSSENCGGSRYSSSSTSARTINGNSLRRLNSQFPSRASSSRSDIGYPLVANDQRVIGQAHAAVHSGDSDMAANDRVVQLAVLDSRIVPDDAV